MVPIDPVTIAASAHGPVSGIAPGAPGPDVIAKETVPKFEAMMKNLEEKSGGVGPSDGHNLLGEMLSAHENSVHTRNDEMASFVHDAPNLSQAELAGREMALNRNIAMDSARMSIATGMSEGLNKSLQSLLKPQ
jgi:hypothetical protein